MCLRWEESTRQRKTRCSSDFLYFLDLFSLSTSGQLEVTGSELAFVKLLTHQNYHYVVVGFKDGSRLFIAGDSYHDLPIAIHEQTYTQGHMESFGVTHTKSNPPRFVFVIDRNPRNMLYESELDAPFVDLLYAPQSALVCRSRSVKLTAVDPSLYTEDWVTLFLSNMHALTVRLKNSDCSGGHNLYGLVSVVGDEVRLLHNNYRSEHVSGQLESRVAQLMGKAPPESA
jgi:hypothetical protein